MRIQTRLPGTGFSPPVYSRAVQESIMAKAEKLIPIPLVRQGRNYTCGVACTQAILRYAGYDFDTREDLLAKALQATEESGTPINNIVEFLNRVMYHDEDKQIFHAELGKRKSMEWLIDALKNGTPVICAIQAWWCDAAGNYAIDHNYKDEGTCGHYVIAVGYDGKRIYFMDPSTAGSYAYIPIAEFYSRWHDGADETPAGQQEYQQTGIVVRVLSTENEFTVPPTFKAYKLL